MLRPSAVRSLLPSHALLTALATHAAGVCISRLPHIDLGSRGGVCPRAVDQALLDV
jgi:hypothetical protein